MKECLFSIAAIILVSLMSGCARTDNSTAISTPDVLIGKTITEKDASTLLNGLQGRPERIARNEKEYYYSFAQSGIDLICDLNDRITTVFLYSGDQKHGKYLGNLPKGLQFGDSRVEISKKLGMPSMSGGGESDDILGKISIWDKYYLPSYSLHVEYGTNGTVNLVTISTLGSDPANK